MADSRQYEYALVAHVKQEPAYQCATCGAWVHVEQPIVMRLNGRMYVGRPCSHCGTFVGVSLPSEVRRGMFISEREKADFEAQNGIELNEGNRIELTRGEGGEHELGYVVKKLQPALQDYVDMLAEQGAVIRDGRLTEIGAQAAKGGDVKQKIVESVEGGSGWWV